MRKLLLTTTAVLLAGGIAYAANVPLTSGIVDPGNLPGTINSLTQIINTNVSGLVAGQSVAVASAATTAEQTLASASIPASTLASGGQTLRLFCAGNTGSNTNTKTVHLYYGTAEISTASMSTSAETWNLQLLVTNNGGTQPNSVYSGWGLSNTTAVAPVSAVNTTDNLSTALTAKCTVTQGTASAADTTMNLFIVEQVK